MGTPACKGCGKCCEFGWKIDVLKEEAANIPPGLLNYKPDTDTWEMKLLGRACIAFDRASRTCRIYESRPRVCSDFVPGEIDCLESLAAK